MREQMIDYLQYLLDRVKKAEERYGIDDRETERRIDEMIACKNMVEALIKEPVNCGLDGKVTVGF